MSCTYVLKDSNGVEHNFKSELELDDFLLVRNKLRKSLGDIVFSMSDSQAKAVNVVRNIITDAEKLKATPIKRIFDEDGGTYIYESPYIGVNRYITNFVDDSGRQLVPVFEEENYWAKQIDSWKGDGKIGKFNDVQAEVLQTKGVKLTKNNSDDWSGPAITDKSLQEELRTKIETKWEKQCLAGDAIHAVFEAYFSEDTVTKKTFKDVIHSDSEAMKRFQKQVKNTGPWKGRNNKKSYKFDDLVTSEAFANIINQAQSFAKSLQKRYGDDIVFFPECKIAADLSLPDKDTKANKLYGIIDLLIIDRQGQAHIFDYKTSLKSYNDYHSSKILTFRYQIALYQRMLNQHGFDFHQDPDKNALAIVPIQIDGFEQIGDTGNYKFSGIKLANDVSSNITVPWYEQAKNINDVGAGKIHDRLDSIIERKIETHIATDNLLQNVKKEMDAMFVKYSSYTQATDEQIRELIKENGGFTLQTDGEYAGKYIFKPNGSRRRYPIVVDPNTCQGNPEIVMFKKVKAFQNSAYNSRERLTQQLITVLIKGQKNGNIDSVLNELPQQNVDTPDASPEWMKFKLSKYCNNLWEVKTGHEFDALQTLGIIVLYNKEMNMYDFIKISSSDLRARWNFGTKTNPNSNKLLSGALTDDIQYEADSNSLMIENYKGNIELMETMSAINNISNLLGNSALVGNVEVINPVWGYGTKTATNKELLYAYTELKKLANLPDNKFASGEISLASQAHIANQMFHQIMFLGNSSSWTGEFANFNRNEQINSEKFAKCRSELHACIDTTYEEKLAKLEELARLLKQTDYDHRLNDIQPGTSLEQVKDYHTQLYNQVLLAIAELRGIDFRQQMKDHNNWIEGSIKKGLSGLQYDNPGNMKSPLLNKMTEVVLQAYQRVRDKMQDPIVEIKSKVKKLKDEKKYNTFKEFTYGNETALYDNLYDYSDGKFRFKKLTDKTLSSVEKDILKYALETINSNRFSELPKDRLDAMRDNGDDAYYNVPLLKAGDATKVHKTNIISSMIDWFKGWSPKRVVEDAKAKIEGFASEEQLENRKRNRENFFEMTNRFDGGEDLVTREQILTHSENGVNDFETNLETLLLAHSLAYNTKSEIDDVMPLLHAGVISLQNQGFEANTEFVNDLTWIHDYIKNRIRNESITSNEFDSIHRYTSKISQIATKLALGLNPVLFTYQMLQGIWVDLGMIWQKPDGSNAFTFENFKRAAKIVYRDLFRKINTETIPSLLNELYGINDMDINSYGVSVSQNKHGIFNFDQLLFRFASRPDFYNRMLLFVSKMMEDGCYEAHQIKNGKLVYDWKKDQRYSKFAQNPSGSDSETIRQRSAYLAAAREFVKERAEVMVNGKLEKFTINLENPLPLPRAYTNLEAESMKSLGDKTYGYYSHEKRSMIQSTLIGSMFMQMRTYWSGKKNQYLAQGGVKLQGHWEEYKDSNNKRYYYQVDKQGNILWDKPPLSEDETTNRIAPVTQWKGDWEEGILGSVSDLCGQVVKNGWHPVDGFQSLWYQNDKSRQTAFRSNIKKLAYDLVMFSLVGAIIAAAMKDWENDTKNEAKKGDVGDAMKIVAVNMLYRTVRNSFMDFNFIESIGGPMGTWTPFSFEYLSRNVSQVWDVAFGDEKLIEGLSSQASALRMFRPVFKAISYQVEN